MIIKTPIRTVFDVNNVPIGLSEYQVGEGIGVVHGGTGGNTIATARTSLGVDSSNIRALFSVGGSGSYDNTTGIITVTGGVTSVGGAAGTVSNVQLLSSVTSAGLLANTNLTGIPLAPTASPGSNTTQVATTAFVSSAVSNLIDSAPGALDTLNELAAAINDDNNFATTIITQLGTKANTASLTTANVTELTNLYFTNARARGAISASGSINFNNSTGIISFTQGNTDTVSEGSSNLYFTNARAALGTIPAVTQLVVTTPVFNYNIDSYSGDNPTIYVSAGETISFALNQSASHPLIIKVSNGGSNFNTGLTHIADNGTITTESSANNKVGGKLFWKVPFSLAGSTYVYQCANHSSMVGNIVIQKPVSTITTTDVAEGNNLYFSNARTRAALSAGDGTIVYDVATGQIRATANVTATIENTVNNLSTANVTEDANFLYFTNARVFAAVTGNLALKANVVDLTTANVIELNSLYFTEARARQAISTSGCTLSYSNTTGIISFSQGNADTINEGSTNLYFTNTRVFAAVTGNLALKANLTDKLSVFGSTTSTELAEIISNKTGFTAAAGANTGILVFNTSPTFTGNVSVEELSASGNITSPFFYSQSDINLKKNIIPLTNALSTVIELNGVSFDWKHNEQPSIGLIAQEVENILPFAVGQTPEGYKTVQYNSIIALLVEAVKEQQIQINALKQQIENLNG